MGPSVLLCLFHVHIGSHCPADGVSVKLTVTPDASSPLLVKFDYLPPKQRQQKSFVQKHNKCDRAFI